MIKAGITGGIGSGKSTVCRIFAELGVPTYDADARSKEILNTRPEVIAEIKKHFGKDIYSGGQLDRKKLAAIVFTDKDKLKILESISHPAVKADFEEWSASHTTSLVLKEAALLYESGSYKDLDKIIVVDSPLELRLKRVMQRDGAAEADVCARIANQTSFKELESIADFIIYNDDKHLVLPQVLAIFKALTA